MGIIRFVVRCRTVSEWAARNGCRRRSNPGKLPEAAIAAGRGWESSNEKTYLCVAGRSCVRTRDLRDVLHDVPSADAIGYFPCRRAARAGCGAARSEGAYPVAARRPTRADAAGEFVSSRSLSGLSGTVRGVSFGT